MITTLDPKDLEYQEWKKSETRKKAIELLLETDQQKLCEYIKELPVYHDLSKERIKNDVCLGNHSYSCKNCGCGFPYIYRETFNE